MHCVIDVDGYVVGAKQIASPNCDARPAGCAIELLVIHCISLPPGEFGGSAIIAPNEFDSIIHGHLLLNANRQGIMKVLRPKAGPTEPENWVSEQVNSYFTANWEIEKTFNAIENLVDTFAGEGTVENRFVKEANKNLDIDFRNDISLK
jgi:hypothetical protein